jgi:probable HAF family extracellular repeat protein
MRVTFSHCLVFLVLAFLPLAMAQGTYTQIDYPGATQTQGFAINDAGDYTGIYFSGNHYHGFMVSGGVFTSIDYPGAADTYANGINNVGELVGSTDPLNIGYLYDIHAMSFRQTFAYPGALQTVAIAINDSGTIGGVFFDDSAPAQGFVLHKSVYTQVAYPAAYTTEILGLSGQNTLVGYGQQQNDSGHYLDFLSKNGKYESFVVPNLENAAAFGINSNGTAVVGRYESARQQYAGFVYTNGSVQILQFPGSTNTFATGINDQGVVVGFFLDAENTAHGFLWTPPVDAGTSSATTK